MTPLMMVPAHADLTLNAASNVAPPPAWHENPLWKNVDPPAVGQSPNQHDVAVTIVGQTPFLSQLWALRQTARGQGPAAQRSFTLAAVGNTPLQMQAGAGLLPALELAGWNAQTPGMGLKIGKVTAGSTAPMNSLNYSLRSYDAVLDGNNQPVPQAMDKSQIEWLSARPLEGKSGKLDLMLAQGRRDLTPQQFSDKRFAKGSLWGASGDLNLRSQWKLHSELVESQVTDQDAAAAWKVGLGGAVRHPWGVATVSANFSDTTAGFATFANPAAPSDSRQNGEVGVQQDVALSAVGGTKITGTTKVSVGQSDQTPLVAAAAAPAPTTHADTLAGSADLRWKLSPKLSLLGKHEQSKVTQQTLGPETDSAPAAPNNLTDRSASDVGVELKLTRSVAVAVTGGLTRTDNSTLRPDADTAQPVSLLNEGRASVSLKRQTKGTLWGVSVGHRSVADDVKRDSDVRAQDVRFEAEHQLLPWLRLKGSLGYTDENDLVQRLQNDRTQRSAGAQLALPLLGNFDLTYSDAAGRRNAADALTALPATHQFGLKYNLGNPNAGGLGLSVEYSRTVDHATDAAARWRVGLTYR